MHFYVSFAPSAHFGASTRESLHIYVSFRVFCELYAFLPSIMASLVFDDSLAQWRNRVFKGFIKCRVSRCF